MLRNLTLAALRLAGAGLVAAMAGIHLHLWNTGYRDITTIGGLFLLNGIVGGLLALALLLTPARRLGITAALGALFTAGTLGALVISLTSGLFGFKEFIDAPWVQTTIAVESAGIVVLAGLALLAGVVPRRTARGEVPERTEEVRKTGGDEQTARGPHPDVRTRPSSRMRTPPH